MKKKICIMSINFQVVHLLSPHFCVHEHLRTEHRKKDSIQNKKFTSLEALTIPSPKKKKETVTTKIWNYRKKQKRSGLEAP